MTFPFLATGDVSTAFLILLRVSAMLMFLPILGHQLVPSQVKIGLIGLISMLLFPIVHSTVPEIPSSPVAFSLIAGQEILIGAMLALLAQLIFAAVQLAGQIMSYQMGMAIANVFNPLTSTQIAVVGQFAVILSMLMWLATGGHHAFLMAIADSFTILPIGHAWSFTGWQALNDAAANMFILGLRLAAPVLLLLFFTYVALGLLSRAVPQIQIFFVSFPLTIGLGLLVFALSMPVFLALMNDGFKGLFLRIPQFLHILAGA